MSKTDFQNGFILGLASNGIINGGVIVDNNILDHTVTFKVLGEPYEIVSCKDGNIIDKPLATPLVDNGTFVYWWMDNNDENIMDVVEFPYMPTEDCDIHALCLGNTFFNAGDYVSSSMGTKTNDGKAYYGLKRTYDVVWGSWYAGYLVSNDKDAVLTDKITRAYEVTYNNETWYYSVNSDNPKASYENGDISPYYLENTSSASATEIVKSILDAYYEGKMFFYK